MGCHSVVSVHHNGLRRDVPKTSQILLLLLFFTVSKTIHPIPSTHGSPELMMRASCEILRSTCHPCGNTSWDFLCLFLIQCGLQALVMAASQEHKEHNG